MRFEQPDGRICVGGYWSPIITKGVPTDSDSYSRRSYRCLYDTPCPDLSTEERRITVFGRSSQSNWITTPSDGSELNDGFYRIGTVVANLKKLRGALEPRESPVGIGYWVLHFDVCIRFGRTELEGFLEWEEEEKRVIGPTIKLLMPDHELS
ncbi:hypothetical protein RSAG8_08348, partial [Rhizoctonia solani AG-8 WAC10335]